MKRPLYCVIFTYSFDVPAVYLFDSIDEAKQMLKDNFNEELKIAREENGWIIDKTEIAEDGMYAVIENPDDKMEFYIGNIYQ